MVAKVVAKGRAKVGTVGRRGWWQVTGAWGHPVVPLGRGARERCKTTEIREVREIGREEMWVAPREGREDRRGRLTSRPRAWVSFASPSS